MRPVFNRHFLAGLAVMAAAVAVSQLIPVRPASAEPSDTIGAVVHLAGSAAVREDRATLLREEFKERQREVREQLKAYKESKLGKHARLHKKARGEKAEPSLINDDYYTGPKAPQGRAATPMGILTAPTNAKANDKSADAAGAGQAEQSPVFVGLNGLCAWNDGQGFNLTPQDVQGYGWTNNGGVTWTDGGIPLKGGTIATWTSDPVVTANEKTGYFYYCGLTTNTGTNNNGVAVARGHFTAGVFGWDAATVVSAGPSSSAGYDKEWMCADSSNGNLYVTWTQFTTTGDNIWCSRSTDNGATWGTPVQINGSWENGYCSGSRPMVGPNGEVYVQYTAIGDVDADSVKIARSTNFGVSFTPAVVPMVEYSNYFTGAPGFNRARAITFAGGAVDRSPGPNRGRVYLTVQDAVNFYGDALNVNSGKAEVENNGNYANATPFTVGQTLRGTMSTATDTDIWKFPATQGTTYIFFVDSLRTSTFRYTMRLYCPLDTTVVSRLALSGNESTTDAANKHALIVWTAPSTATYYLRMVLVGGSGTTSRYRILTGSHVAVGSDVARDARDITVASSADGQTAWTPRVLVNDDAARYDNWLPEIAVPCDGLPYVMWYDWRDTPACCNGGSNIYMTRSTNAGATWAASQVVTSAATANWTQVSSNIAPNQGDYNGMYGGDCISMAWADGRLGDPDVYAARLQAGFTLSGCPGDQVVLANTAFSNAATLANLNSMFGNNYSWTLTVNRNWPGLPASGSVSASAGGTTPVGFSMVIPDTATHGEVVHACLTINCASGGCAQTCCFDLTVNNLATGLLASLVSSSADAGSVRLAWHLAAPRATVERSVLGSAWNAVGQVTTDASEVVSFVDRDVQAGMLYTYRLAIPGASGVEYDGKVSVQVPRVLDLSLRAVTPNPSTSGFEVSFALPNSDRASLELLDISGHRLVTREVGSLGAGYHTVSLQRETANLPVGVYALRLIQGNRVRMSKVSIIH